MDMSLFIKAKSDQINADDLIGGPLTVTVTRVSANEGNADQPINVFYEGDDGKPFRPCKTMRRVMVNVWGADASKYVGRSMTLYRDPKVKFGGMAVGGIRISHMTNIDKPVEMLLTATRAKREPYTVKPLIVEQSSAAISEEDAAFVLHEAEEAAKRGSDTFRQWYKEQDPATRAVAQTKIAFFKDVAEQADNATDEDPFGGDGMPSEEERARAMAQAEAEIRNRDEASA